MNTLIAPHKNFILILLLVLWHILGEMWQEGWLLFLNDAQLCFSFLKCQTFEYWEEGIFNFHVNFKKG